MKIIFSKINHANREYIRQELCSFEEAQSLNMLFEIAVLGFLLSQFSDDKIVLYPRTQGRKNVEAKLIFNGKEIFLDVTALNDSQRQQDIMTELIKGGSQGSFVGDIPAESRRIESRLREKELQFLPNSRNIVLLFLIGTWPVLPGQLWDFSISNLGLVMVFDRQTLQETVKICCDPMCYLSTEEEASIKKLFAQDHFISPVY